MICSSLSNASIWPKPMFSLAGQVIAHEVLKDDADSLPQVERVQLSNVDAVDQYRALGWIVKAAQEFDQGRFAGAVGSH